MKLFTLRPAGRHPTGTYGTQRSGSEASPALPSSPGSGSPPHTFGPPYVSSTLRLPPLSSCTVVAESDAHFTRCGETNFSGIPAVCLQRKPLRVAGHDHAKRSSGRPLPPPLAPASGLSLSATRPVDATTSRSSRSWGPRQRDPPTLCTTSQLFPWPARMRAP
jgi:hypothetical protein